MDILGLIPSFGGLLYTIVAFIIALSVIVFIHEYGHYIVGRWSGIRAEVFSVGFGPILWSRVDKRGTRWQVAALPIGGFVKFAGDANAASAPQEGALSGLSQDERRATMQGAPLWARSATVAAGPIFNFILSFLVFAAVILARGVASDPLTIDELRPLPAAVQQLEAGDQILSIAGLETPSLEEFDGFVDALPIDPILDYTVLRDGRTLDIRAPYPYPPIVLGLSPQSAAIAADMELGDVITAVDGVPIHAFSQLRDVVSASNGQSMLFDVWRAGETLQVPLTPKRVDLPRAEGGFETRWLIGISGGIFFEPATATPSLREAASYGVTQTWFIVTSSLSGLYHMAAGAISTCNLSGPIGIAETSSAAASQGLLSFIWFIAVLSTAVGLLNLFPIPILDGGHLVFHAYEAIAGRPPSDRSLRVMMATGLGLMLTLMVFAITNDLFCP